jgi:hypothetical protein
LEYLTIILGWLTFLFLYFERGSLDSNTDMKRYNSDMPGILSLLAMILTLVISGYFTKKHNEKVNSELEIRLAVNKQFVCPLHPQVIQDSQGYCPICGSPLNEVIVQYKNNNDTTLTGFARPASGFLAQ